jgi:hypothetical protein
MLHLFPIDKQSFVGYRVPIGSLVAPVLPSLCPPHSYTLKIDLASFSETFVLICQTTHCHVPEYYELFTSTRHSLYLRLESAQNFHIALVT